MSILYSRIGSSIHRIRWTQRNGVSFSHGRGECAQLVRREATAARGRDTVRQADLDTVGEQEFRAGVADEHAGQLPASGSALAAAPHSSRPTTSDSSYPPIRSARVGASWRAFGT